MVLFLVLSFVSAITLVLLGYRVFGEEHRRAVNRVFALFCFAAAYVAFCELGTRLSESGSRALVWAHLASGWPLAPAFFLHFSLLLGLHKENLPFAAVAAIYGTAAGMALLYVSYVREGYAVYVAYGYTLQSPIVAPWPYWLTSVGSTLLNVLSLLVLTWGSLSSALAGGKRQVRWILAAYVIAFVTSLLTAGVNQVTGLAVPELNGPTYALFAAVVFLGIQQRNVIILTPTSTGEHIVQTMGELFFLTDDTGRILSVNRATEQVFGGENLIGNDLRVLMAMAPGGGFPAGDIRVATVEGLRWLSFSVSCIYTRSGELVGRVFIARDVTEDRRREARLASSLREKESLLREVHHRVNNSLQLVNSLLDLKGSTVSDAGARRTIDEIGGRVRLIAHIYEQVYSADDVSSVSLRELLRAVVADTAQDHESRARIEVEYELEEIEVDLHTAIPLAIVIAELVSNVFQHAFPDKRAGKVVVESTRLRDDGFSIAVDDDGVGFVHIPRNRYHGLDIAEALCHQAGAELKLETDDGTRCTITSRKNPEYDAEITGS